MVIWRLPLLVGLTLAVAVCSGTDPGPTAPVVPLQITTTSLRNGVQNADYGTESLGATGGVGSYAWSVVSGALPAGLSLSSGGDITGTPTGSGTTNFMVEVTSGSQTERGAFSITVNAALQVITTSLASGAKGEPYDHALAVSGGDGIYSWFVVLGALPPGLSLATNGALSGTPSSSGTFAFTVEVKSRDGQAAQRALSVSISDTAPVTLSPTDRCSDHGPGDYVTFADSAVVTRVRDILGTTELTCADVATVQVLSGPLGSFYVTNLAGVQNLTGLEILRLNFGAVTDLSPLTSLVALTELYFNRSFYEGPLGTSPAIIDLGPLSGLHNLERIWFTTTPGVRDIAPLAGLENLTSVYVERTGIRDLSPLANPPKLVTLVVKEQHLPDISMLGDIEHLTLLDLSATARGNDLAPLAQLTELQSLNLFGNVALTDIDPLLANPGIGAGDFVNLFLTGVSCADIEALEAKGVTVQHNCLSIVTESIPVFVLNEFASLPLLTSDNRPPAAESYTWSLVSGPMPPGLAFAASGEIVGTPTVAGSWVITVEVKDVAPFSRSAERSYTLVVALAEG